MTRRDWWLGVLLILAALVLHAALPRYTWQHPGDVTWVRIDRWTGRVEPGHMFNDGWLSLTEVARRKSAAAKAEQEKADAAFGQAREILKEK